MRAANSHRVSYLIKHTLDQANQQAAHKRGQHCPEEVQHRHYLLSEVVPTSSTVHAALPAIKKYFQVQDAGMMNIKNIARIAERDLKL